MMGAPVNTGMPVTPEPVMESPVNTGMPVTPDPMMGAPMNSEVPVTNDPMVSSGIPFSSPGSGNQKKKSPMGLIIILIILILGAGAAYYFFVYEDNSSKGNTIKNDYEETTDSDTDKEDDNDDETDVDTDKYYLYSGYQFLKHDGYMYDTAIDESLKIGDNLIVTAAVIIPYGMDDFMDLELQFESQHDKVGIDMTDFQTDEYNSVEYITYELSDGINEGISYYTEIGNNVGIYGVVENVDREIDYDNMDIIAMLLENVEAVEGQKAPTLTDDYELKIFSFDDLDQ